VHARCSVVALVRGWDSCAQQRYWIQRRLFLERCDDKSSDLDELVAYLSEATLHKDTDVLDYWKKNGDRYPKLKRAAQHILAFPGSTGTLERQFSIAGAIQRARRNRIGSEFVEGLIMLREYKKKVITTQMLQKFNLKPAEKTNKKRLGTTTGPTTSTKKKRSAPVSTKGKKP